MKTDMGELYSRFGISDKVYRFGEEILDALATRFAQIDENAEYNQLKVIRAMQEANVSEA